MTSFFSHRWSVDVYRLAAVTSSANRSAAAALMLGIISCHLRAMLDAAQFSDVAGLAKLKAWVQQRRAVFTGEARARDR